VSSMKDRIVRNQRGRYDQDSRRRGVVYSSLHSMAIKWGYAIGKTNGLLNAGNFFFSFS
jgi:hypothetical protein